MTLVAGSVVGGVVGGGAMATTTTLPGTEITISGGPNATANIPGPNDDASDFYGIIVVLVVIVVAIAVTRFLFGRGGGRAASR